MKKSTFKKILGAVCMAAIFLGCAEYSDGGPGIWNLVCLAVAGLSGWGYGKLEEGERWGS